MFELLKEYAPWVKVDQLQTLGLRVNHIYFLIIFGIIFMLNLTLKPVLKWLTNKNYMSILSYLASSFTLLFMSLVVLIITNDFGIELLKSVLQVIMFFGICLAGFLTYQMFKKRI